MSPCATQLMFSVPQKNCNRAMCRPTGRSRSRIRAPKWAKKQRKRKGEERRVVGEHTALLCSRVGTTSAILLDSPRVMRLSIPCPTKGRGWCALVSSGLRVHIGAGRWNDEGVRCGAPCRVEERGGGLRMVADLDFWSPLFVGSLHLRGRYTCLAMFVSRWAGCIPVARHHSGPHISTRSCSKPLGGLPRRFRLAMCLGARTALYKAAVSALY